MKPGNNASHTIEQVRSLVHLVSVLDDCDTKSMFAMEDTAKCAWAPLSTRQASSIAKTE